VPGIQGNVPQLAHVGVRVEIRPDHRNHGPAPIRMDGWSRYGVQEREVFWLHPREPNVDLFPGETGRLLRNVASMPPP
jgi:hypothetical protein